MNRIFRITLFSFALVTLGLLAGHVYGQRYASKEPIPGTKRLGEITPDFDVWRLFDPDDDMDGYSLRQGRIDTRWRVKFKEEFLQAKPTLGALAQRKREVARQAFAEELRYFLAARYQNADSLIDSKDTLLESEIALCGNRDERVKIIENLWLIFKKLESDPKIGQTAIPLDPKSGLGGGMEYDPRPHHSIMHARLKLEQDLVKAMAE